MPQKPKIIVSSLDMDRLDALLNSRDFPGKEALREELDRAEVRAPDKMPDDVVTMNSTVKFRVAGSGKDFSLTLVYPKDHDGQAERISILAPVGSALLGLAVGNEIEWPRPGGGSSRLQIIEVIYQPERAGELYR
jgi:regulator of nucleoside diphosphate kinase